MKYELLAQNLQRFWKENMDMFKLDICYCGLQGCNHR